MFGSVSSPREGSARKPLAFPSPTVPEVRSKSWYWWWEQFYDDGYKRPISSLCVIQAYVTSFIVDFVMMFVVMVTNLILCINYEIENDESRLMMKTRLLPGQRRALALINPALFLIIQRCLCSFFAMSWAVRILLTQKNWYMQAQAWGVS